MAVAKKHGARIGHFEWCDDFSAARNESLKMATGDWILVLDCDETISPSDFDKIRIGIETDTFAALRMHRGIHLVANLLTCKRCKGERFIAKFKKKVQSLSVGFRIWDLEKIWCI